MPLLRNIHIQCQSCGHAAELGHSDARRTLNRELTHENVPALFGALKCTRCGQRRPRILDEHREFLYGPTPTPAIAPPPAAARPEALQCIACGRVIDAFHLADKPGALLCASCEPGSNPPPYPQPPPHLATCPRCRSTTVFRQNSTDGDFFIGCSTYPKCRWTNPYP